MSNRPGRAGQPAEVRQAVLDSLGVLTIREAAKAWGVSTASICKWRKEAGIASLKGQAPSCHPERPNHGHGLCAPCYKVRWAA